MSIADLFHVDETGLHHPDYPTVLDRLKDEYRAIYGDVYLEPDSQDGQWITVLALAMYETILAAAAVYNSFSPLTAQADALSRNVKINGLVRKISTRSQVDLRIVGTTGTIINNGIVKDTLDQKWELPAQVVIPVSGEITVTATSEELGAISAQPNTITKITVLTLGWQSVTNPAPAVEGDWVETDAALRQRQATSTMIPTLSIMEGITGAVAAIQGVHRYRSYENDTPDIDANGVPSHSLAVVIEGGDNTEIAQAIATKKTIGTGTFGNTSVVVTDDFGVENTISFLRPSIITIDVEVSLKAFTGYLSTSGEQIKQAVAEYLNSLEIGEDIFITKLFVPANLNNVEVGETFDVTQIRIKRSGDSFQTANIVLAFDEMIECDADANVTVIAS